MFTPELADSDEVVSVSAVFLAALFSDGLEDLDRGAQALFGGLSRVAVGEFVSGLCQEMLAGLLVLLGHHRWLLLLVSDC